MYIYTYIGRKKVVKNWEEDDFYSSDEDTFLDRTGISMYVCMHVCIICNWLCKNPICSHFVCMFAKTAVKS